MIQGTSISKSTDDLLAQPASSHGRNSAKPDVSFEHPPALPAPVFRIAIPGGANQDTMIFAGNCLAEEVGKGIRRLAAVSTNFEIHIWLLHLEPNPSPQMVELLKRAKHVFIQQISHVHNLKISELVSSECKLHRLPNLSMLGLWPFDSKHYRPDKAVDADTERVFINGDGMLAQLRELIPDKFERFEAYRNLEIPGLAPGLGIKRRMEIQVERLLNADAAIGCSIGKFLVETYQERPVFYDCTHATGEVYQKLCEYCLDAIGVTEDCSLIAGLDRYKRWSVPVQPGVARRLGVKWALDRTTYQYGILGEINWRNYVMTYIDRYG